jgi:hypothetical protein
MIIVIQNDQELQRAVGGDPFKLHGFDKLSVAKNLNVQHSLLETVLQRS